MASSAGYGPCHFITVTLPWSLIAPCLASLLSKPLKKVVLFAFHTHTHNPAVEQQPPYDWRCLPKPSLHMFVDSLSLQAEQCEHNNLAVNLCLSSQWTVNSNLFCSHLGTLPFTLTLKPSINLCLCSLWWSLGSDFAFVFLFLSWHQLFRDLQWTCARPSEEESYSHRWWLLESERAPQRWALCWE